MPRLLIAREDLLETRRVAVVPETVRTITQADSREARRGKPESGLNAA